MKFFLKRNVIFLNSVVKEYNITQLPVSQYAM